MTETSLNLVSDEQPVVDGRAHHIPGFEGEAVVATKAKITSVSGLEVGDRVFRIDESVKLIVECTVISVDHKSNPKGELERIHLLKAIDSLVVAWDLDMDALKDALGQ